MRHTNADAAADGQWRVVKQAQQNITHMRGNGDIFHWDYTKGTNTGGNSDAVGTMGVREAGC